MVKITAYGVRELEEPYFQRLNTNGFELTYVRELLTHENVGAAADADAVLVRGNCVVDRQNLQQFANWGIKAVFTRSVGYNHMDLQAAADLGITLARVPGYSPYAVAELAFTLGMTMFRHVNLGITQTQQANFIVNDALFSKEIHTATVGIVGAGRIGLTEGKLYQGLGAHVLGYDPYPSAAAEAALDLVELPQLLAQSDIVSIHVPYFPGKNDDLVDADFIKQMKPGAVLINTARGELVNVSAVLAGLDSGQISGYGADVIRDEVAILGQAFASAADLPSAEVQRLLAAYPRVLITPHVGSYTEPALEDMIRISYQNFQDFFATGHTTNEIK
ncbi:NAD(P)-dependent oxidoreductase [Levilactobacillus tujiorum]|uniref:Lactate dehydrogenase n=1 Tax=Levilactobacillus tujiorum TaxID=2912243 RepID=A0ABX1L4Z6_9LACO|nr:NAD(P)-dependent oxidoreductase [Levilactobacillus tujiorum]MCH5464369.1 lactate dehydrogenase [Levilactobacillus tujiorum]NLR11388.1 lactate dehydrogenase [Lactobacillus sp. HBUAS51387]NLR29348.1 lactate dehydrogenase [Levilactobacillus tujiorum]